MQLKGETEKPEKSRNFKNQEKMKRTKLRVRMPALILTILLLSALQAFNLRAIAGTDSDGLSAGDVPEGVRVGWRAGFDKVITGYEVEHFGWVGAHFSKLVPVYETRPCCRYTGDKMDGCSAPHNCNDR